MRFWWIRYGPIFAAQIRKKRSANLRTWPHWRCHLDEVFVKINGQTHDLWLAVDHEGEVFEVFVTKRRDRAAALKFLKPTLKRHGRPKTIVTDRLRSYRAALKIFGKVTSQECGCRFDNRAENSHLPIRRRERKQQGFKSAGSAQRFLSVHAATHNTFYHQRHLSNRANYKQLRAGSFDAWAIASAAA